jgi:phosphate transport system protein
MSPVTQAARHFHEELARLKDRLLEMSGLAEELVRTAVEALLERDETKASAVVLGDREVDALEVEIDDVCLQLLALQQPFAGDLRLITAAMRVTNDLERVGDHAVNIAQAAEALARAAPLAPPPQHEEMARNARQMLSDALDAFVRRDAALAREIPQRDARVDALHDSVTRHLLTQMMEEPRAIGAAMRYVGASGDLERVADLATNIAEDTVFLIEGRTIRHHRDDG